MTDPTDYPSVSIVIPVYNDPEGLEQTLESVTTQSYPTAAYDVLVVDNGSTDGTRAVARRHRDSQSNVQLFVEDTIQGSYAARNLGIENATGELIAFLDADITVEKEWLETAVNAIQRRSIDYMGSNVVVYVPDGVDSITAAYNRRNSFPIERYVKEEHFAGAGCLIVRRDVFDAVGPFDPRLVSGGDVEFGNRVYDAGFELGYEPSVKVYHPARSTLRATLKKSARVGRGSAQLARYYPDRYGHLGVINPIRLARRQLGSETSGESEQGTDETTESLPLRVAFRGISVLENVWYLYGRVRGRIHSATQNTD